MIVLLSRPYLNRHDVPIIERVDTAVFERTFLPQCATCNGSCCAFGVCVDFENIRRIEAWAPQLEQYVGIVWDRWFTGESIPDPEYPAGGYRRTQVIGGACVFLDRNGSGGCLLHAFCLKQGMDHHLLKPMLSSLFPVTAEAGLLRPATEVADDSLACLAEGITLYRGGRDDLLYYYGSDLIRELDRLERVTPVNRVALR
jgi:hypothetical protein